jgi:predicted DNA-binding protein
MKKDTVIITRINKRLKEIINQVSQKKGSTLSGYLHELILQDLEKRNIDFNTSLDK